MKKTQFFVFLGLVTGYCNNAPADDLGVSAMFNGPLPVDGNNNSPNVQAVNSEYSGKRFDITYYKGDKQGPLLGIGYGYDYSDYYYPKSSTETFNYGSTHEYPFLKAGYWFEPQENMLIMGFLHVGYGKYTFQERNKQNTFSEKSYVAENCVRGMYGIDLGKAKFDLIAGAGITKQFISNFSINDEGINARKFGPYPFLQLGIGFRF